MGIRVGIPLPGPFYYTARVPGDGCITLIAKVFIVWPIMACVWSVVAGAYIVFAFCWLLVKLVRLVFGWAAEMASSIWFREEK